jgi:hypothetical protein
MLAVIRKRNPIDGPWKRNMPQNKVSWKRNHFIEKGSMLEKGVHLFMNSFQKKVSN